MPLNSFFYAIAFLIMIPLVGWPSLHVIPTDFNSDVFQYLTIANYYLYFDATKIYDAGTVGPVIPLILYGLKFISLKIFTWWPQLDIFLLCLLTVISYFCGYVLFLNVCQRLKVPKILALFLYALLLFLLPSDSETLSPNGELISSAFICLAITIHFRAKQYGWSTILAISTLLMLAFFTKVQSAPIILITILSFVLSRRIKWRLITACTLIGIIAEAFLFVNDAGIFYNSNYLINYVLQRQTNSLIGYAQSIATHLSWIYTMGVNFFPYISWIFICHLILGVGNSKLDSNSDFRFSKFWWWFFITTFVIYLPNRTFPHYLIFFLPMVIIFSAWTIARIIPLNIKFKSYFLVFLILLICIFKVAKNTPFNKSSFSISSTFIPFELSSEANEVRSFLDEKGDNFYVHGWDFRYYSYFNKGSTTRPHLFSVQQKMQIPEAYISALMQSPPKYLLDIVEHSGFIRGDQWRLDKHPAWEEIIINCYTPVFDKSGLRLYVIKKTLPIACHIKK